MILLEGDFRDKFLINIDFQRFDTRFSKRTNCSYGLKGTEIDWSNMQSNDTQDLTIYAQFKLTYLFKHFLMLASSD